jgi:SpoVK/Ycf46/Vps4 family AAA+-type ATPase
MESRYPRAMKDALAVGKTKGKVLVILGCRQVLPPELEREFVVLDFSLPDKAALGAVLDGICKSAKLKKPEGDEREHILDAAAGMTCAEAENAFALSVAEVKAVEAVVVAREKASTVKKNGLLEVVTVRETLDDIGGLDVLKDWLLKRKDAFSQRAREYGLPSPKGLLIVGRPGTGKSLTAKATASVFGRPLLKLDAGRLYGSLMGQSEGNQRSVIQVAEAIKARRKELGLTQEQVTARLCVARSWLGKVEQRERRLDLLEAWNLCRLYGIGFSEIEEILSNGKRQ